MTPAEYRQSAARCLAVAELSDGLTKKVLLEMAGAWQRLAEQAEKNLTLDLVYETPLPRRQQQPVSQQQQQIQPKQRDDG
jgi:hypothetical protein